MKKLIGIFLYPLAILVAYIIKVNLKDYKNLMKEYKKNINAKSI